MNVGFFKKATFVTKRKSSIWDKPTSALSSLNHAGGGVGKEGAGGYVVGLFSRKT